MAAGALGTTAAAASAAWRGGGQAAGWVLASSWAAALLNMVLDVSGTAGSPLLAAATPLLRSFAPPDSQPRQLDESSGARMIAGSLNPAPRLGISAKLLQEVTAASPGGGVCSGSGPSSAISPSSSSSSFGAAGDGLAAGNDTHCGEQILSYGHVEKVVIGAVLSLITLLTVAGNCLVVISVCFVKKLRQPSNYLIVSLAVADLSVAVAVMPFVSVTDLIGGEWIFGSAFCNVFIAMDVMCCTASIMTLCVISIDR